MHLFNIVVVVVVFSVHSAAKIDHFPMKSTEVLAPSGMNTGNIFAVRLECHRLN